MAGSKKTSKKMTDLSPKKNPTGGNLGKDYKTRSQDNITLVRPARVKTRPPRA